MSLKPEFLALIKGAKNKYSRNTSRTMKLKEGKTRIRVLQASAETKFWADLGVHWIKTEKGGKPAGVVGCHDHVHNEPCPVCTMIEKCIRSAVDDESLQLYKEMKTKRSVLVNALIRSGEDKSDEPVILELTPTTFGNILSMIETYADDYGNVLDPKTGMDFTIERKGKGLDTEYTVMPNPKSEPVPKTALDKMADLDDFIEKEFFRDNESKMLSILSQMSGLPAPTAIGGPARSAMLTKPVEEEEAAPPKAKAAAAPEKKAPVVEDEFGSDLPASDIDDLLSELDDL